MAHPYSYLSAFGLYPGLILGEAKLLDVKVENVGDLYPTIMYWETYHPEKLVENLNTLFEDSRNTFTDHGTPCNLTFGRITTLSYIDGLAVLKAVSLCKFE